MPRGVYPRKVYAGKKIKNLKGKKTNPKDLMGIPRAKSDVRTIAMLRDELDRVYADITELQRDLQATQNRFAETQKDYADQLRVSLDLRDSLVDLFDILEEIPIKLDDMSPQSALVYLELYRSVCPHLFSEDKKSEVQRFPDGVASDQSDRLGPAVRAHE